MYRHTFKATSTYYFEGDGCGKKQETTLAAENESTPSPAEALPSGWVLKAVDLGNFSRADEGERLMGDRAAILACSRDCWVKAVKNRAIENIEWVYKNTEEIPR